MKNTYRLIEKRDIKEYGAEGCVYEHLQTGARVFTLKNSDKNKVFLVGFRTTPSNSTGVAHIMEHSVLCGSAKYPIKDPFVELAKGSLNTFLNAMTYPDKTVYPVASVNDKDFMNLMDVYLDSVFHPNVYSEPKIFRQEGWHYELDNVGTPEEKLSLNGVVYNEMKGAFSNPDAVLERFTLRSLFPDTTYANESGGLPSDIPALSYREFLDFHRTYYHPSNAWFYLYGDMDMEEKLQWLDEQYLCDYDRITVNSEVQQQAPFDAPRMEREFYAVSDAEPLEHKTYLSENFVMKGDYDQENALAWQVLEFVLLSSPGAILREALIKAGIGEDVYGGFSGEIRQPYFSIIAKNTDEERLEDFRRILREKLEELVTEGISKKSLEASLNFLEFKYREGDFGTLPQGLSLGLGMFASWLYDRDPYTFLYYEDAFRSLRSRLETDYFENLIRDNLLENQFSSVVSIVPKKGLQQAEDEELYQKLDTFRRSLSEEVRQQMALETLALKAYQQEPDTPFNLAKLPVLQISDIGKEADKVNVRKEGNLIFSEADTHGIAYMRILFDTNKLSEEELQLASFLKDIYGEVNTASHSYRDLFDELLLHTGGVSFGTDAYGVKAGEKTYRNKGVMGAEIRTLEDKIGKGFALTLEMLNETELDNPERIRELLLETRSHMQAKIDGAMHSAAVTRASSYFSKGQRFADLTAGIAYFDFIKEICRLTEEPENMKKFIASLQAVEKKLFNAENAEFVLYGSLNAKEKVEEEIGKFLGSLRKAEGPGTLTPSESDPAEVETGAVEAAGTEEAATAEPECDKLHPVGLLNEGFRSASQVNYVARCGRFDTASLPYTGALRVLRVMLNYEYLWINLRVLGGAYGCMANFSRTGRGQLVSYRDPHIARTNEIYEKLPDYLESWDGDEDAVRKYIIGAISGLDQPLQAPAMAACQLIYYYAGVTDGELQEERDQVLACTPETLRGLAKYIRAILDEGAVCTLGNAAAIDKHKDMFGTVRELY